VQGREGGREGERERGRMRGIVRGRDGERKLEIPEIYQ